MTVTLPKSYPHWIFDGSPIGDPLGYGERAVNFIRNLKHPKSALPGRPFRLDAWMERIIRRIYGPRHADGTRIAKTVFAMIPRGNRKTTLGAALTLLHSIGPERVQGGQVVCAAADQKQARIAFEEAIGVIREDRRLTPLVDIADYRNRLTDRRSGTVVEAISADAKTQHGRTPTFVLSDELHAWPKRDLWEALKTGLLKTAGSLNVIITTAGRGQSNTAHDAYDYARRAALGEIDDPAWLPILFEAPRDADWTDEELWHAVNPGLALGYPDLAGLRQYAREAENRPAERESFKRLSLNIWSDSASDPFVDMAVYDEGAEPIDLEALEGRPCWLGVDLSSSIDLSVIVAAWPDDDGGFTVWPWFFCPADNIGERESLSGAPYRQWVKDGLITATPGNVIDVRTIEDMIRDLTRRFDVREIAFDPALARITMSNLLDDGFPAVEHRQGSVSMMPSIAALERAIIGRKFRHGGHPVLRFCFANAEVETNAHDHKTRLHKSKLWLSIDGAVAAAMAVGRAATGESGRSMYDDPNFDPELLVLC